MAKIENSDKFLFKLAMAFDAAFSEVYFLLLSN